MKMHPTCFPCVLRMSIESLSMSCEYDAKEYDDVVRLLLAEMKNFENDDTPPQIISRLMRIIKTKTGVNDPYCELKKRDIIAAEAIVPTLDSAYPDIDAMDIETACFISAVGNTLDSGVSLRDELSGNLNLELKKGFVLFDGAIFEEKLDKANTVLVLGDNIGEAILDRYLLRKLRPRKIFYAVRGEPVLNDTSVDDIEKIAIDGVEYVSTESDLCGVLPSVCSEKFSSLFNSADIVISKGMGNYETLSTHCRRDVFYLLKAKCEAMAEAHDVNINDYIFKYSPASQSIKKTGK